MEIDDDTSLDSDDLDDDDSWSDDPLDDNDLLSYWMIPLPKMSRKQRSGYELFALDNKPLNVPQPTFKGIDHCIDHTMKEKGDLYSLIDLVRGQRNKPSPTKRQKRRDLKPIVCVRFNTREKGKPKPVTLKALLDSGGSGTLVTEKHAKKLHLKPAKGSYEWSTPAGTMKTAGKAKANFTMPEFYDNRLITWDVHVAKSLGAYDMIIGRDVMKDLGIDLSFSADTITWEGVEIPFKDTDVNITESYYIPDPGIVDEAAERLKTILDAKYEKANLEEIAKEAAHLTKEEQARLLALLESHETLFDGTLGHWKSADVKVELKPDAIPYHARSFPVPRVHEATLKQEVERLCRLGVLKKVNRSEWAAPTFIIPKKDGSVRFISDFREWNKRIKRKPYPIPKIQDLLIRLEGFQHATSLDLNMGYYHIELCPDSKKLCTIVLPFGKFEYQRLPMGLCNSPDIFQEKMSQLMTDLEYVRVYIDDLLVLTSGSFEDHLEKLHEVFERLERAGLKVNAKKSFFAREELEYLGFWITRNGIQPLDKKVEAMRKIAPPKTKKELRGFIGLVNYYRDMWSKRSHILAPLAALTSKTVKWKWEAVHQKAFDTMKQVIAKEVLLAFPDFSKPFEIHTDASLYQLGAVISQDGKPIAFYSRKLKPEQTRYTTTERELLSIVETLKEFRNILLGHKIVVHTDHMNLTYKTFNTERVMRWRLILEEYGPELRYIKGPNNIVADALSRLTMLPDDAAPIEYGGDLATMYAEIYAYDVEDAPDSYPLIYAKIANGQDADAELQDLYARLDSYKKKDFKHGDQSYRLITREDKICLPKNLQRRAVEWYHSLLAHPGETRMELTLGQHFHWKNMRKDIQRMCGRCHTCQLTKPKQKKYGHLPEKQAEAVPWQTVCIDLIGPYKFGDAKKKTEISLHCLTMIDPATGWFEIAEIPGKSADEVANTLEQVWLTRYPWPEQIVMDRGPEFKAEIIDMLRDDYGIVRKPITTRNPQANAMVERCHQTLHNMIRSHQIRNKNDLPPGDAWKGMLAAVAFAMRATVHTTTRATPTQLVFNRDAIHNVRFEADWQYIKERKQRLIRQNLAKENSKRVPRTYAVGEQVLVLQDPNRKHGADRYKGPYTVTHVHDNGTVRLEQHTNNGGVVTQTWNLRNIFPYKA